jgi:chemotaxis protein MotA
VDLATLIGLLLGCGGIIGGMVMEGGNPAALLNIPSIVIVFGGTLGAAMISFPLPRIIGLVGVLMNAFFDKGHDPRHTADLLVSLAEQSRREGLLSLESKAQGITDPFIKKSLLLMIDGTDPERLRSIMEIELAAREQRHEEGLAVLETMGGFAPTMGIIGTVLGLINVLSNLSDTSTLGHKIAGAFIATFYGVFSANIIFLPLGNKLKARMKHEAHVGEMSLEGVISIQAGDNPRIVREKLDGFLPPKLRAGSAEAGSSAGSGSSSGSAAGRAAA